MSKTVWLRWLVLACPKIKILRCFLLENHCYLTYSAKATLEGMESQLFCALSWDQRVSYPFARCAALVPCMLNREDDFFGTLLTEGWFIYINIVRNFELYFA